MWSRMLLECNRIHSPWYSMETSDMGDEEDDEEDIVENENIRELEYTNGSNGVVKIFSQKCVISLVSYSDYIFKQCRHQCICDVCYRNKGDI